VRTSLKILSSNVQTYQTKMDVDLDLSRVPGLMAERCSNIHSDSFSQRPEEPPRHAMDTEPRAPREFTYAGFEPAAIGKRNCNVDSSVHSPRRKSGENPKKESTVRFHPLEASDSAPPDMREEIAPISKGKLRPIIKRSSRVPPACSY
jgi:hypothetical protein